MQQIGGRKKNMESSKESKGVAGSIVLVFLAFIFGGVLGYIICSIVSQNKNKDEEETTCPPNQSKCPEVFAVSLKSGESMTYDQAVEACRQFSTDCFPAVVATQEQLEAAWQKGGDWCKWCWVQGGSRLGFPQQTAKPPCGDKVGLMWSTNASNKGIGVNCYAIKPTEEDAAKLTDYNVLRASEVENIWSFFSNPAPQAPQIP